LTESFDMSQPGINSPPEDTSFEKLVLVASTFSIGAGSGFAASIQQINPTLIFSINLWTFVFALLGASINWWMHRIIFDKRDEANVSRRKKKGLIFFMVTSAIGIFTALTLSLRGISAEKFKEVMIGVIIALMFVSMAAFFFLKMVQFLKEDEKNNALKE